MSAKSHQTSFIRKTLYEWEIFVLTPDGVKFGLPIQTAQEPSPELILEIFKIHYKSFFIEAEIITTKELDISQIAT